MGQKEKPYGLQHAISFNITLYPAKYTPDKRYQGKNYIQAHN